MVRALFLLSLFFSSASALADDVPFVFKAELSKTDLYEGEQTYCHFVLYGREDALEVEVAKFPEFRGYWSENLALRQGPLPMQSDLFPSQYKKTTIGTYVLTSMIKRPDAKILPMRVVVRSLLNLGGVRPEVYLLSEIPKITLKPLPPLPEGLPPESFSGAVGNFSINVETTAFRFEKNEPFSVRFLLQGEGNFQEVNQLPFKLPPNVELISRKASQQGSGQYGSKTFELVLVTREETNFDIPPLQFVFFNPGTGQYESRSTPMLRFTHEARGAAEVAAEAKAPHALDQPEPSYTAFRPLHESPWFWISQLLLAVVAAGITGRELSRRRREAYRRSHAYQSKLRWAETQRAYESGDWPRFLRLAEDLVVSELRARSGLDPKHLMTRSQLLHAVQGKLPEALLSHARHLFDVVDRSLYSGAASDAPSSDLWRELSSSFGRAA